MFARAFVSVASVLLLFVATACSTPSPFGRNLVVGSDLDNPPFASVDAEGDALGRDVAMTEELARRLGTGLVWRRMPFDELLDAVASGAVDAVVATLGITPEREERVLFTRPYYTTDIAIVVRTGGGSPRRIADLEGGLLSAGAGTTSERAVLQRFGRGALYTGTKNGEGAAELVLAGRVDGAVMDGPNARAIAEATPDRLRVMAEPLAVERYAIAVRPDAPELRDRLSQLIGELEAEGVLTRLNLEHGLLTKP